MLVQTEIMAEIEVLTSFGSNTSALPECLNQFDVFVEFFSGFLQKLKNFMKIINTLYMKVFTHTECRRES